jgi:hypothetical protein
MGKPPPPPYIPSNPNPPLFETPCRVASYSTTRPTPYPDDMLVRIILVLHRGNELCYSPYPGHPQPAYANLGVPILLIVQATQMGRWTLSNPNVTPISMSDRAEVWFAPDRSQTEELFFRAQTRDVIHFRAHLRVGNTDVFFRPHPPPATEKYSIDREGWLVSTVDLTKPPPHP